MHIHFTPPFRKQNNRNREKIKSSIFGAEARVRTGDLPLFRRTLYQLSYLGKKLLKKILKCVILVLRIIGIILQTTIGTLEIIEIRLD